MSNRIRFSTARQVIESAPGLDEDFPDVPAEAAPLQYLAMLRDDANPAPALLFAALMLPKREAVWWGCLCLRGLRLEDPKVREGLALAEAWVRQPDERERRAAGEFTQRVNFKGSGAWIAFAAFTSGGSLTPADLPAVPPPPDSCARAIFAALMQATVGSGPASRLANMQAAIDGALDFGAGGDGKGPWRALIGAQSAPAAGGAGR